MKRILLSALVAVAWLTAPLAYAQGKTQEGGILLDQHDKPVSKEEFMKLIDHPDFMLAKNDSLPIYKAVGERSVKGQVQNYEEIITTLTEANIPVDRTKPIVILFYPGKDACNSSGSAPKAGTKPIKDELTRKTQKIAQTTPLSLYRTRAGLEKYNGTLTWQKDPQQIIEKTFFKYHYPCGSYVIIAPNGKYISYLGEYADEELLKDLKKMMQSKG